ncbi:MAG: hypothetical protein QM674_19395, partial [Burkholderiaceae bacterium]
MGKRASRLLAGLLLIAAVAVGGLYAYRAGRLAGQAAEPSPAANQGAASPSGSSAPRAGAP